jgi:hypothetical protein
MGKYPLKIRQLSKEKAIICSFPRPHLALLANGTISLEAIHISNVSDCCRYPFDIDKYFFLTNNDLQLASLGKNDLIMNSITTNLTPKQIVFDQITGMLIVIASSTVLSKTEYSLLVFDPQM